MLTLYVAWLPGVVLDLPPAASRDCQAFDRLSQALQPLVDGRDLLRLGCPVALVQDAIWQGGLGRFWDVLVGLVVLICAQEQIHV